jgi:hypothetical protein
LNRFIESGSKSRNRTSIHELRRSRPLRALQINPQRNHGEYEASDDYYNQ